MELRRYLNRLHDTLYSKQDLTIEFLQIEEVTPAREGIIEGRLRFWDGSLLKFVEVFTVRGVILLKTDYAYHYQDNGDRLIFRYDNAPHHPEIITHPHHKHVVRKNAKSELIEPCQAPQIHEVLKEIDHILYSSTPQE